MNHPATASMVLATLVLIKHATQFISRSYKTALHGNGQ